jgi:predicted transcriptional regulator with HTH domain
MTDESGFGVYGTHSSLCSLGMSPCSQEQGSKRYGISDSLCLKGK